jgi:hypothetical protein
VEVSATTTTETETTSARIYRKQHVKSR